MRCSFCEQDSRSDSYWSRRILADSSEDGIALLELAIVASVFLFLFFCAYDAAQMINRYVYLSQAAFEGARSASMVSGLTRPVSFDIIPHPNDIIGCNNQMPHLTRDPELPCALIVAQFRARRTLDLYRPHIEQAQVNIAAHYEADGAIFVEAWTYYRGVIPLFRLIPISATFRLPYLALNSKRIGPYRETK